jgi:hypothetical protein
MRKWQVPLADEQLVAESGYDSTLRQDLEVWQWHP